MQIKVTSWLPSASTFAARKYELPRPGRLRLARPLDRRQAMNCFHELYRCPNVQKATPGRCTRDKPTSSAMRGYGIPQAMWAGEGHIDDICRQFGFDPLDYRLKMIMADGHVNKFSGSENCFDSPRRTPSPAPRRSASGSCTPSAKRRTRRPASGAEPAGSVLLVQHRRLADRAGVLREPHGPERGRQRQPVARRDQDRAGRRHRVLADDSGRRRHPILRRARGLHPGHRRGPVRHRRVRVPADLRRGLHDPPDR